MTTAFVNFQLPQTTYSQFESIATRLGKSAETLLVETLQVFLAANNTPMDEHPSEGERIHEHERSVDALAFADSLDEMVDLASVPQSENLSGRTMNTLSSMTKSDIH